MKKLATIIFAALIMAGSMLGSPAARAEQSGWAVDFDFTLNSKYVWRGQLLVDDWVVQPSLNVSKGGFTANVWGNYEPTDETGHSKQFTEVDLTAEYAFEIGKFSIPVGVIHYMFPNTSVVDTTEIYAGVSYDWIVSPSLTVYHDVDAAHGQYVLLGAGYSHELPEIAKGVGWGVDLSASVAYSTNDYNDFYFGVDESGWSDWSVGLAIPFSLLDGKVSITPAVTHTALIDSKLKDTREDDSNTFFGVSLTLSF